LFVGLIAGVMLLRSHDQTEGDQQRALPAPLPDPGRAASEPRAKSKAAAQPSAVPAGSASGDKKPVLEFLPADSADASPTAPPESAAVSEPRPAPKQAQEPPAAATGAAPRASASSNLPDGGWVKPEWAIPDGDPVRRAPIEE
jgi:hypothetical protein